MKSKFFKILLILLANVVVFSVAYLILEYFSQGRLPATRAQFLSREEARFYRHYASMTTHLREFQFLIHLSPDIKASTTDYMFTRIGKSGKTVLIQGDSWAEQFITSLGAYATLDNFAIANDINFVVGGTASYAPSPMAVQYRLLRQDFNVDPSIVIGIIDQTDIGDELCRYRSQISKDEAGETIVRPYSSTDLMPYSIRNYFDLIDILDEDGGALVRLLKYKLKKLQIGGPSGCSQKTILAPLAGNLTPSDRAYFEERLAEYIASIFRQPNKVEKLILVTHFHRGHLTGEYSLNVSELIQEAISKSSHQDKISQLDFSPTDYRDVADVSMFQEGDPFSHLTNTAHRQVYLRKILQQVQSVLGR